MDRKDLGAVSEAPVELQDYEHARELAAGGATASDAADMIRMGKQQLLKRNFVSRPNNTNHVVASLTRAQRFFSIIAFVTIMQGTWESTLVANYFGLYDGGTAGVIWLTIIVWLCMIATIACMVRTNLISVITIAEFNDRIRQKWHQWHRQLEGTFSLHQICMDQADVRQTIPLGSHRSLRSKQLLRQLTPRRSANSLLPPSKSRSPTL